LRLIEKLEEELDIVITQFGSVSSQLSQKLRSSLYHFRVLVTVTVSKFFDPFHDFENYLRRQLIVAFVNNGFDQLRHIDRQLFSSEYKLYDFVHNV
jgi:hypothetical protein